jgi:hypothetical protein
MMNSSRKSRFAKVIAFVILGIVALGAVVMALWNWLIPELFAGGRTIDYWQALGILVLSKILFGGFRGHRTPGDWHRDRWQRLSPEEREKLKSGFDRCFGGHGSRSADESRT